VKEFDFEELDRAVNSAIGGDSSSTPSQSDAQQPEAPVRGVPFPARESTVPPRVGRQESPAARRSSGRFMDVMHPSSDMRTATVESTLPTVPSSASLSTPAPTPETEPEPEPETASVPEVSSVEPVFESRQEAEAPKEEDPRPVAESPFLPDAVVEKRPLGATPFVEPKQELLEEGEETPLLEAGEQSDETRPSYSIPSSKRSDVANDDEPKALYDTETYHAPAASAAPKKKTGLWITLWVVGLIVLGAAVGVATYFFVLPLL